MIYEEFAAQCCHELTTFQDKLRKTYDIDSYTEWFYDQYTGLLTLSKGDDQINFRYVEVGSLSEKSNTWMWAWNNDSILEKARVTSLKIKDFGKKEGYQKLIDGFFESDDYDAWEFTAIALKLLGGQGAYRPYNDQLKKFLILQDFVDNDTAAKIKSKYIECTSHERGRYAFVCKHLLERSGKEFHEAFESSKGMPLEEDEDFQAWCEICEDAWQRDECWTEDTMADVRIVCETCYFDIKEFYLGHR